MRNAKEKESCSASWSQGIPCKIPSSYTISQETLEEVREIMNEDVSDTVAVLKALSDPIRVRILKALHVADLCVCVLVELMDCEYSKLSYHLGVLKKAGLIDYKTEGNFWIYHLTAFGEQRITCLGIP
jgi:DNA-binding transcriptional ArsR family regulator